MTNLSPEIEKDNLRITLNSIGDGVIATDTEGNVTQINPAAEKLTGYTFESARGKPLTKIFNIVNAKTKETVVNPVSKVLEFNTTVDLANHTMLIAKDGTEYHIADSAAPIRDADGNIAGVVLVFRDVTEKYHLEEIVLETNQRLQGALDASNAGTWRVDLRTGYDTRDASLNRLLGLPAEPSTQPVDDWFTYAHPGDAEVMKLAWEKALETGSYSVEHRLIRKDGEVIWVYDRGRVTRDDEGELSYAIGAVMDITERKKSENALRRAQKMDAIGQLTGGIAHDFNNILGIIIGNLDLLNIKMASSNADILEYITEARKAAIRATELTKKLLGFSRHRADYHATITDINNVIKEMDSLIARSLTPEVTVDLQMADDLWFSRVDPGDLEDALLNLVINARDVMPQGGRLTLETSNRTLDEDYCSVNAGAKPGEYVELAVSDSGTGIPAEQLDLIFEPFFTTKPQGKGTGLGLAMVYGFVKRSAGYIKVYSEVDIGTTIRLYLPRAIGETQLPVQNNKHLNNLPRGHDTILVVDDEECLLKLAESSLSSLGYRIITASNGEQALACLNKEPDIALLFSDVVMPGGMNGYELAEQATLINPNLKVLLTSGYTEKVVAANGQARFRDHILSKPYTQIELAQQVKRTLSDTWASQPLPAEANAELSPIEWTDDLITGITPIDEDHKALLDIFNSHIKTDDNGRMKVDNAISALKELQHYADYHFQREETIMHVCDYPQLENHRQVHQLLIKQLKDKITQLERENITNDESMFFLRDWLLGHIQCMDLDYVPSCMGKKELIEKALK